MATLGELTKISDAFDNTYDPREFKRGEIYYVDLDDIGYSNRHISTKSRPALIIQNNRGNSISQTLIVALITSADKKDYPFQYKFLLNGRQSTLMGEQLMTLDKFRVGEKYGELTPIQMREVEKRLMYSLEINKFSLDNVKDIDVLSVVEKKTKVSTTVYFEFVLMFTDNQSQILSISLDKLKLFDKTITKETDFSALKKTFDCCRGLNWLVNNCEN